MGRSNKRNKVTGAPVVDLTGPDDDGEVARPRKKRAARTVAGGTGRSNSGKKDGGAIVDLTVDDDEGNNNAVWWMSVDPGVERCGYAIGTKVGGRTRVVAAGCVSFVASSSSPPSPAPESAATPTPTPKKKKKKKHNAYSSPRVCYATLRARLDEPIRLHVPPGVRLVVLMENQFMSNRKTLRTTGAIEGHLSGSARVQRIVQVGAQDKAARFGFETLSREALANYKDDNAREFAKYNQRKRECLRCVRAWLADEANEAAAEVRELFRKWRGSGRDKLLFDAADAVGQAIAWAG